MLPMQSVQEKEKHYLIYSIVALILDVMDQLYAVRDVFCFQHCSVDALHFMETVLVPSHLMSFNNEDHASMYWHAAHDRPLERGAATGDFGARSL